LMDNSLISSGRISRQEHQNIFEYNQLRTPSTFTFHRPFKYYSNLICELLSQRIGAPVYTNSTNRTNAEKWETIQQPFNDKLLEMMMHDSDNFMAEQLLLQCGMKLNGTLNTKLAIEHIQDSLFHFLSAPIKWVDGSGLSRYNLCTPHQLVETLNELYRNIPMQKIRRLFPTGGVNGSIKDWYGGQQQPYVFAKTGSLSGVSCLSGYIQTKKGRTLAFSFMHNNYLGSATPLKKEMAKILQWIYLNL